MSAAGERLRIREQVERLRAMLDSLEIGLRFDTPLSDSVQPIADAGSRLVAAAARHDVYLRVGKP